MNDRQRVRRFAIRWILLSGVGFAAGLGGGLALGAPIEALVGMMLVTPIVLGIAGCVFGTSQWLAIKGSRRVGVWWVVATTVGMGLGLTIGIVLVETVGRALVGGPVRLFSIGPIGRVLGLAVIGIVAGAAVGTLQRWVLRHFGAGVRGWIPVSIVALGLGLPGGALTADLVAGGLGSPWGFGLFLAAAGLVAGLVTARSAVQLTLAFPRLGAA